MSVHCFRFSNLNEWNFVWTCFRNGISMSSWEFTKKQQSLKKMTMSFDLWWMPTLSFQWTSFIIMYSYSRKSHIFISTSKLKVWPGIFVKLSECSQDVSLCFHNSFCSFLPKMLIIALARMFSACLCFT